MSLESEKKSPDYLRSVVALKTRRDDPKEMAITEKVRQEVLTTDWAKERFDEVRAVLVAYMREVTERVLDATFVHDRTQGVLKDISVLLQSRIVEGAELLAEVPQGSPVLIVTNHFGAYKLWGLDPKKELGVEIENYDYLAPFPGYFAALHPIAEALGDRLYYASNEFPGIFGEAHERAGFIHLPPSVEGGRTAYLEQQTREKIAAHPHSAFVIFPEGTTSGKPQGGHPYALNPFKTGPYVIAAELGIHIVPVVQYFDPNEGFHLKVLQPYIPLHGEKAEYEAIAEKDRVLMQKWLDHVRS